MLDELDWLRDPFSGGNITSATITRGGVPTASVAVQVLGPLAGEDAGTHHVRALEPGSFVAGDELDTFSGLHLVIGEPHGPLSTDTEAVATATLRS